MYNVVNLTKNKIKLNESWFIKSDRKPKGSIGFKEKIIMLFSNIRAAPNRNIRANKR